MSTIICGYVVYNVYNTIPVQNLIHRYSKKNDIGGVNLDKGPLNPYHFGRHKIIVV